MADKDEKMIWNANIQEYLVDGIETVDVYTSLKVALYEADGPDVFTLVSPRKPTPKKHIPIKREDVEYLVAAFERYLDGPDNISLGKCFGFEGVGRGKSTTREQLRIAKRNTTIAVGVRSLIDKGLTKRRAIEQIAEEFGMEAETVRKSLKKPDPTRLQRSIDRLKE